MSKSCGCTPGTCHCCEGTRVLTPVPVENRPGLNALRYRAGTHWSFFESMKARLAGMTVVGPGADGQTVESFQPFTLLTTRQPDDPAIALLDSWATVADVLTFYQERIANEGYLRTATERRSVLELARLVGYTLRPGVASTVYLAYTLEDTQSDPVVIPAGSRSQSIPGPGEMPQSFETSDDFEARSEWNNLQVRSKRAQQIDFAGSLALTQIIVAGVGTALKPGDILLLVFDGAQSNTVRKVESIEAQFTDNRTVIHLQPAGNGVPAAAALLTNFLATAPVDNNNSADKLFVAEGQTILTNAYLGTAAAPAQWVQQMRSAVNESQSVSAPLQALSKQLEDAIQAAVTGGGGSSGGPAADPSIFVGKLLEDPNVQPPSSQSLARDLASSFQFGADTSPQLLINLAPKLQDTFYKAWANAAVNQASPALKGVYAMRAMAPLFGSTVPRIIAFDGNNKLKPPQDWDEWSLDSSEQPDAAFLDQPHDAIAPGSYALVQAGTTGNSPTRGVCSVASVSTSPRSAYGISANSTRLVFDRDWWDGTDASMEILRKSLIFAQAEALQLADASLSGDVTGQSIELASLFRELKSGRWAIITGERSDVTGSSGIQGSELLMITGLVHGFDANLPNDQTHTTLQLATPTKYSYKRDSVTIYGNVGKATHGETRHEILGNGDGAVSFLSFQLKQPPLTFVPAPTPEGTDSTLHVYVNDVEWRETDTLAALGPKDRKFVTKTDNVANTTVVFGNGEQGARVPTGSANVTSIYRNGIGRPGNVRAQQISMLLSKPLGVKAVINPLPATGGADAEDRDQARKNAPLAVTALDRLVGLQDYADFTRTFAGIGKANAQRLSDGRQQMVHITIAGADDIPIDTTSDLYRNLLLALRKYGDPALPIRVDLRELEVLVVSARIAILPGYRWDPVSIQVRQALLNAFSFQNRDLGQPALKCEVINVIQNVEGVRYVDLESFGGIPEKKLDLTKGTQAPERRFLTLAEFSQAGQAIAGGAHTPPSTNAAGEGDGEGSGSSTQVLALASTPPLPKTWLDGVSAQLAGFEGGVLHPAQLAILLPDVEDTIILNQIL